MEPAGSSSLTTGPVALHMERRHSKRLACQSSRHARCHAVALRRRVPSQRRTISTSLRWKRFDDEHRLTIEDRRDFVGAALMTGELTVAAKQVDALLAQRAGPAPIDIVFAGQVAARQSDPVLALDYAERALSDKRAKPYEILSAATLVLSVSSRQSQQYASAWKQIEDVARDLKNPASLDALTLLAHEEALPPMPAIGGKTSLSLESTPAPSPTPAAPPSVAGGVDAGPTPPPTPPTQSGDTVTLDLAATSPSTPVGRTMRLKEVADALENHPEI